ncbi:hypothetical protein C8F04DRAFT_1175948 [Mycena alexandri]|uniref:Uncharacterized protein n=1 Tax=Mycena alexandri TaxID=1745969 RepID=A0AAD6XAM3_9AGAR|nr:hypothetical protein C8F04DRAFT_1175948 [Mycena alexandri]
MIFEAIVKDTYSRLLNKLYASPAILLASCVLGQDFAHSWTYRRVDGGGDSAYVLTNGAPFEPVLVGTVASTDFGGVGRTILVLRLPSHATHEMAEFFAKQISCLSDIAAARCELTADLECEDVIPWNYGDTTDLSRIHLHTYPETSVRRCTPTRCLDTMSLCASPSSSSCSTSSSSTLSSTDDHASSSAPQIEMGDLLAVQCKLTCRDFPRPDGRVVKVFSLYATKMEIII